jgi:hypothetical protein
MKAATGNGCRFRQLNGNPRSFGEPVTPPNRLEARPAVPEPSCFQTKECAQQPEDALHLGLRPMPIIRRERVERETADSDLIRALNDAASRHDPCAMTRRARQSAPLRPPSVAVHDDGHMKATPALTLYRKVNAHIHPNFASQS